MSQILHAPYIHRNNCYGQLPPAVVASHEGFIPWTEDPWQVAYGPGGGSISAQLILTTPPAVMSLAPPV